MRTFTLEQLLAELGGTSVGTLDRAVPGLAEAEAGAGCDVAVARTNASGLTDTLTRLRAALRPGGTAVLIAPTPGLFGMGSQGAPEPTDACAALLEAGFVEIGVALTPGKLRRQRLLWGTLLAP